MTIPGIPAAITTSFRKAIQVGVVVSGLDRSMAALTAVFGIGPFRVVDGSPPGHVDQQFYPKVLPLALDVTGPISIRRMAVAIERAG